jgi:uncharacterized membrane protein YfbV (UPF0208 family)
MGRCLVALALILATVWPVGLRAATPRADEITARAGVYVANFIRRFSSIVAEERFVQEAGSEERSVRDKRTAKDTKPIVPRLTIRRELVSDYLLVQVPGRSDWHAFRDVFQIDGLALRDRDERLERLFLQPLAGAMSKAVEIDREGVRYSLGDPVRTLNSPLLALGFLQMRYQSRFRFSVRGADPDAGPNVWIVEYVEQVRPTVLRRVPDADLPARGRFWINAETGTVVQTELVTAVDDVITTIVRVDDGLFHLAVPVEMRENYWHGTEHVLGIATYSRFRQFSVETAERRK